MARNKGNRQVKLRTFLTAVIWLYANKQTGWCWRQEVRNAIKTKRKFGTPLCETEKFCVAFIFITQASLTCLFCDQ